MPYISVSSTQPHVPVTFVEFGNQSDAGAPGLPVGYPIPNEAKTQPRWIEGGTAGGGSGGDDHMLIVDRDRRILYELYHTRWNASLNRWEAGSGAIFGLDSNRRRPEGWTSADAAGLAILPGLVRYDEVFGPDPIRHAFRVTVRDTNSHVFPASHTACNTCSTSAPPMGTRLRLKASKDISGFPPEIRKIFQAMKTYGLIIADNGSDLFVQGQYDTRWNNDVLNPAFSALKGGDFEVIQRGWKPATPIATAALQFFTLPPCRLYDTRDPFNLYGGPALPPGEQKIVSVAGRCGIPQTAKALSVNVTLVLPPLGGSLSFFAGDEAATTATIHSFAGRTRANNQILKLSASGTATLGVLNTTSAAQHVIVDVNGYFE
jgi:hypothetical protein